MMNKKFIENQGFIIEEEISNYEFQLVYPSSSGTNPAGGVEQDDLNKMMRNSTEIDFGNSGIISDKNPFFVFVGEIYFESNKRMTFEINLPVFASFKWFNKTKNIQFCENKIIKGMFSSVKMIFFDYWEKNMDGYIYGKGTIYKICKR
jgi:hypothetical protein